MAVPPVSAAASRFYGVALYTVRPSTTYSFEDQLGLVRGTKSKIEDEVTSGRTIRRSLRSAISGELNGYASSWSPEFRKLSLLSAAPFHHVVGPSATLVLPDAELHWGWATEENCSES